MRTNWLEDVEAASAVAGAAVLCSVFAQRSFTQHSVLTSEIVCWSLLPILLTAGETPGSTIPTLSDYSNIRGKSVGEWPGRVFAAIDSTVGHCSDMSPVRASRVANLLPWLFVSPSLGK
ncbi:hypothetical protein CKM354_001286700 [Cercospora kikuchii]|uniref:Uncharacterized protein n=1 Tax=Cercospora kikuchii TaxID=84275 RepID=A0A9P3FMS5_9PEZI|nr:uncharacterized protein CKM354_001286700 [Cercospora kikuchii]GIZ49848.1 hypothetical protein CKM354_001286700 [Cercospora kikuchii]